MNKSSRSVRRSGYLTTTHMAVLVLLLILFVSVGYYFMLVDPAGSAAQSEQMAEYQEHRRRWLERRPGAVRYVIDRDCECSRELDEAYVATEAGGEKIAEFPAHVAGKFEEADAVPANPLWIDDLFEIVELAISTNELVSVNYDFSLGFPVFIHRRSTDGEARSGDRFEVRDFEIIRIED